MPENLPTRVLSSTNTASNRYSYVCRLIGHIIRRVGIEKIIIQRIVRGKIIYFGRSLSRIITKSKVHQETAISQQNTLNHVILYATPEAQE